MKYVIRIVTLVMVATLLPACNGGQADRSGPTISDISTSDKVLVISDCQSDSVTITARASDESKIDRVLLWYRVGSDQPFAFTEMDLQDDMYAVTVKGSELQGQGYGAMEFYITAEDEQGNASESAHDTSIQFLPCVNN